LLLLLLHFDPGQLHGEKLTPANFRQRNDSEKTADSKSSTPSIEWSLVSHASAIIGVGRQASIDDRYGTQCATTAVGPVSAIEENYDLTPAARSSLG
jgi:hypothetical protein